MAKIKWRRDERKGGISCRPHWVSDGGSFSSFAATHELYISSRYRYNLAKSLWLELQVLVKRT